MMSLSSDITYLLVGHVKDGGGGNHLQVSWGCGLPSQSNTSVSYISDNVFRLDIYCMILVTVTMKLFYPIVKYNILPW